MPLSEEDFKLIVEKYLEDRGFTWSRIPELRKKKTPDYNFVRIPRSAVCLGELKAPELHLNPKTNLFMHLTKIRKLREFAETAVKQFESSDKNHKRPWVLIFTSAHFQFHGISLLEALRGYTSSETEIINDFREDHIVKRTAPCVSAVDLYLWLQISSEKRIAYQATYIKNGSTQFIKREINDIVQDLSMVKAPYGMDRILLI